jgi:dihydrofolate synthase/folylpolyglutamate synthase
MTDASNPSDLAGWLAKIEGLHPASIALGLDRVRTVANRLGLALTATSIVVAGTNGKGSTCAMLEAVLLAAGYSVGCYTSPHLVHFNERARIQGVAVDDAVLMMQFQSVFEACGDVPLTYFEFTTLAVLRLFAQASLDVAVLEVGMGGRLDAVNLVDADCAIVTNVDIDHASYLGTTREQIGWEKAHVWRAGRPAILGDPAPPSSVLDYADALGADLWCLGRDFNFAGDRQQWNWAGRGMRRHSLAYPALRGVNQLLNASMVLAALAALQDRLPVSVQAVRQGLASVSLPGRFQVLAGRPVVVLDVAHNPHAAGHLAANLDVQGFFPRTFAIVGMMRDKDIRQTLAPLVGCVDHWFCVDLPGPRGATAQEVAESLRLLVQASQNVSEHSIVCVGRATQALEQAQRLAHENDRIVIFGSFLTVADVLASRSSPGSAS